MQAPKRFAGDLWAIFNWGNPNDRYAKFLQRGKPALKQLIESILLHPQTVVPTDDFMSLAVLVGTLGERSVISLLDAGRLTFVRLRGSLAYIGNGGGLRDYEMLGPEGPEPHAAPADAAIRWALSGLTSQPTDPRLPALVLGSMNEVTSRSIADAIRHETYMDVLNSPKLRNVFALRNRDMNHLKGVDIKGVRIYGGVDASWTGDEIDVVMAMATANLEIRLAQVADAQDSSTAAPIAHLLRAKAERSFGREAAEAFTEFREIADIPDVAEAVLTGVVPIERVLHLAESTNGQQFQGWFHENCRGDTVATAREYASLLKQVPGVEKFPTKVLRFIATTLLGRIPVIGDLVSAVDSFFLDRWLKGSSPKYFVENLQQLSKKR